MDAYTESVCKALRETQQEYPKENLENAVIIDTFGYSDSPPEQIGGVKCMFCALISGPKLANVPYKVASFFDDVYVCEED